MKSKRTRCRSGVISPSSAKDPYHSTNEACFRMSPKARWCMLIVLVLSAVLLSLLFMTLTSYTTEHPTWEYELSDNGTSVTITKYNGDSSKVTVPEKIKKLPVTAIGERAFEDCTGITDLKLPDTVKTIGRKAFAGASDLSNLSLADVSEIHKDAFKDTAFEKEYVSLWESGDFSGVLYAGKVAYKYMSGSPETSITLEEGTTGISDSFFDNSCTNSDICRSEVKKIYIPASTNYIPDKMFDGFDAVSSKGFTGVNMYGVKNSYASEYAGKYSNIRYTAMNSEEKYNNCDMDHYWYDAPAGNREYEIKTADDLRAFQDLVRLENEDFYKDTVVLANDIDLGGLTENGYGIEGFSWNRMDGFRGTFDGKGHKITGVYMNTDQDNTGFFGSVGSDCTIRNLTIEGKIYGKDRTGGIVGSTSKRVLIENCTFKGTVSGGYDEGSIGGIIGYARQTEIKKCSTYGSVTSAITASGTEEKPLGYTGGIAGYDYSTTITDCINYADITGNDNAVGGIAGQSIMAPITDSINKGSIRGSERTGGITGNNMKSVVSGCSNSGVISGHKSTGGIAGYSIGTVSGKKAVKDCINEGIIKAEKSAGGIIGYDHDSPVSGCTNKGSVAASKYAGGIAGYSARVEASDCINKGNITADSFAAGILAFDSGDSTLTRCSSSGNIKAEKNSSKTVNK